MRFHLTKAQDPSLTHRDEGTLAFLYIVLCVLCSSQRRDESVSCFSCSFVLQLHIGL